MISGIIDPPGAFASVDEWRAFLLELRKMPASGEVAAAIAAAEAHVAAVEAEQGEEDDFADLA